MDVPRLRRLHRETQEIDVVRDTKRHIVVSPTVTRRPRLDAMLGMSSMIAEHELERMRDKAMNGSYLGTDDQRAFKEICELLLKQTRLEMEVEKHVEQRMATMEDKDLTKLLENELHDRLHDHVSEDVAHSVVYGVLNALGLGQD